MFTVPVTGWVDGVTIIPGASVMGLVGTGC